MSDRIKQIERGLCAALEREVRQIVVHREQEYQVAEHRAAMERKHHEIEERKKIDQNMRIEEHAARAAQQKLRKERALARVEEERNIMATIEQEKIARTAEKRERIARDREESRQEHVAAGEAKREHMRRVREEMSRLDAERRQIIFEKVKKHDDRHKMRVEQQRLDIQERRRMEMLRDIEAAEKREALRQHRDAIRLQVEGDVQRRMIRSDNVKQQQAQDIERFKKIKEEYSERKAQIKYMVAEAEKSGNVEQIRSVLNELKEHAHASSPESLFSPGSPLNRRPRSARSAGSKPGSSPDSTIGAEKLSNAQLRAMSAPRSNAEGRVALAKQRREASSTPEVGAAVQDLVSQQPDDDTPPLGSYYGHLMGVFNARAAPGRSKSGYVAASA